MIYRVFFDVLSRDVFRTCDNWAKFIKKIFLFCKIILKTSIKFKMSITFEAEKDCKNKNIEPQFRCSTKKIASADHLYNTIALYCLFVASSVGKDGKKKKKNGSNNGSKSTSRSSTCLLYTSPSPRDS